MKKVRVLFFIYQMGAGGAARTLLNILNNLDRDRFEPVLVTLNYDGSYESEIRDDVLFLKVDTRRLSRSIFQLAKMIKNEKIDVVFSTIPRVNTIAIIANWLSKSNAKNVVREADNLDGNWLERLKLKGFGWMYKRSSQVISLSEGVKQNLVERYGLRPETIKVIYNPVDLEAIEAKMIEAIDIEDQVLFKKDRQNIVTAGRLVAQKDQQTLLKAFKQVNDHTSSRLIILGEGELESELKAQAETLNVADHVYFIGFKRNPYAYFHQADLFVLSSKHEGFSHVIAEALATRTPVVSTDCKSGPSEVLDNGQYGHLVPVGDDSELAWAMLDYLNLDKQTRDDIMTRGYKRAQTFKATDIVKQYESVFLDVLK